MKLQPAVCVHARQWWKPAADVPSGLSLEPWLLLPGDWQLQNEWWPEGSRGMAGRRHSITGRGDTDVTWDTGDVFVGGLGEPMAEVLAWWGRNGLDSQPAATGRFLMRFPINNTRKWLQLNLSAPVGPLHELNNTWARSSYTHFSSFACAAAALTIVLLIRRFQIYVISFKPLFVFCCPHFIWLSNGNHPDLIDLMTHHAF